MDKNNIATCGMNCNICDSYLKKRCKGCRKENQKCSIKNCEQLKESKKIYCGNCYDFPCDNLKKISNKYLSNYKVCLVDNLEYINQYDVQSFIKKEEARYTCKDCGKSISMQTKKCISCSENTQNI